MAAALFALLFAPYALAAIAASTPGLSRSAGDERRAMIAAGPGAATTNWLAVLLSLVVHARSCPCVCCLACWWLPGLRSNEGVKSMMLPQVIADLVSFACHASSQLCPTPYITLQARVSVRLPRGGADAGPGSRGRGRRAA